MCQSAAAIDYCVAPATCANQEATLEDALVAAGGSTNGDRIFLGADTYTAPTAGGYSYTAANSPVELIGAGQGQTVLTAPTSATGVLVLTGSPANALHDLTIATQTQPENGVRLDGGTLEDSSVSLGMQKSTVGVSFGKAGGTLRNSTARRRQRRGDNDPQHGDPAERHHRKRDDAQALFAGSNISVDADGLTIVAPPSVSSSAVTAFTGIAANVDVDVRDTAIRGFHSALYVNGNANGAATINASWSDYDGSHNYVGLPQSSISESHITNAGDAGFIDAANGDFRLVPSSPLVDAGDPMAQSGADLDGSKLIVDGNGDGTARRDIGAFEFQPLPPAPTPIVEPAPESVAPSVVPADTQAPLVSAFSSSNRAFAVGRARTAVSALARGTKLRYALSEAAKVTITIKRVGAKRSTGKLARGGKAGANVIRFSGRIGKRALRAGRYRAVITAVDAAGNRSVPRSASFRVVA